MLIFLDRLLTELDTSAFSLRLLPVIQLAVTVVQQTKSS